MSQYDELERQFMESRQMRMRWVYVFREIFSSGWSKLTVNNSICACGKPATWSYKKSWKAGEKYLFYCEECALVERI